MALYWLVTAHLLSSADTAVHLSPSILKSIDPSIIIGSAVKRKNISNCIYLSLMKGALTVTDLL